MSAQPVDTSWPAGFRIRPSVDLSPDAVEVADVVSGRRFRWTPEALAAQILQQSSGPELSGDTDRWSELVDSAARDSAGLIENWRHWEERRWHPSGQYYIASRRNQFIDEHDADGRIRTETIERLLEQDGPPPAEDTRHDLGSVSLGEPAAPGSQKLSQLLVDRRSGRSYVDTPVPVRVLSGLLQYGLADIRARRRAMSPEQPLSYLESFGSAWDFYVCVYNVEGVEPGVYRYDILSHELRSIRPGQHRQKMITCLQGMRSPSTAAWTVSLVADFPRYQWRYRHEHGLRRLYLEAGIIGQDLIILGSSYGLSSLISPAQSDRLHLDLHRLPRERYSPLTTLTMGRARRTGGEEFFGELVADPNPDQDQDQDQP
jgi:SagB-type dehydrogenase family enzyme